MKRIETCRELAQILQEFDLTRIEYEAENTRVVLEKQPKDLAHAAAKTVLTAPPAPGATHAENTTTPAVGMHEVLCPLVGVLYRAADPDAPPFADIGQTIKKGDPLCLVEAMKMFNEIPAPCNGIVREIRFQNEDLAEVGKVLMVLEEV